MSSLELDISQFNTAEQRDRDCKLALEFLRRFAAPPPKKTPFQWVIENIVFNEPEIKGPFDPIGREYMRQPIDDRVNDNVIQQILCMGTGSGKTLIFIAGEAYEMFFTPHRTLWVMPSTEGPGGAKKFNTKRFQPMLEATGPLKKMVPQGSLKKSNFTATNVTMGGNVIDFGGSNSPGQLAANRCSRVVQDEIDKFKDVLGDEAGAIYLADERMKNVPGAKGFKSSSPTIDTGNSWKLLVGQNDDTGSDCRRRFLPCPHCNGETRYSEKLKSILHGTENEISSPRSRGEDQGEGFRFPSEGILKGWFAVVWSEQYTILPTKFPNSTPIPLATIRWDPKAKRNSGVWDVDAVIRTTHLRCPHCHGEIHDNHRVWMDKNGVWIPTLRGAPYHAGYHLPSMCAPMRDFASSFGGMAAKFLKCFDEGNVKGMVNSDFAEPAAGSAPTREMIELLSDKPTAGSVQLLPMMSVDRQAKYPGFWYVVRLWTLSVLRAPRKPEEQIAFLKALPGDQKTLCEKTTGSLLPPKEDSLYSPHAILAHIQRTDHWPNLAAWLVANGFTGKKLSEFFQIDFQTDLTRLLEFLAKQKEVNVQLGKQGDSEAVEVGSADAWEELDEVQRKYGVANPDVIVDAKFGQLDNSEVFAECYRRCPPNGFCFFSPVVTPFGPRGRFSKTPISGYKPFAEWGWTPVLGYPEHKVWPSKEKMRLPYVAEPNDPFIGKMEARNFYQWVFKFDAQWALSELARVRQRYRWGLSSKVQFGGTNSEMHAVNLAEYNRHMNGYFWNENEQHWDAPGKRGGSQSRRNPNHLYDCEKNMVARAVWKGVFRYEQRTAAPVK